MKKQTKQTEQKPTREVWIYLGFEAREAMGRKLFGEDEDDWKIQCAACGAVFQLGYYREEYGDDALTELSGKCLQCGTEPKLSDLSIPYSARLIFDSEFDGTGEDVDIPCFDFYRTAETGERARATGIKNTDELRFGDSE
jgi:hypothetical protein